MASERILQSDIARLGQSQADRTPPALDPASAPIDARTPADRVAEARRLAAQLNFYADDPDQASGRWNQFFPPDAEGLVLADDGATPPHLGLLGAFLDMLAPVQEALNQLGDRHLDFQVQRVLGFTPLPAQPEHVHLCLEAKKGAAAFAITPAMVFSGGKDAQGAERRYAPLRETVIGPGRLIGVRSIHRDGSGLHVAPVADSRDGQGEALDPTQPSWPAFGQGSHPAAPVGFAFASSLLRMAEGVRSVSLGLELAFLSASGLNATQIAASLDAYVSGRLGWLGPYALSGGSQGGLVTLAFTVPAGDPPVVDAAAALHGAAYTTALPVVQFLLKPDAAARYPALAGLRLDAAQLEVTVNGLKDLILENDFGSLNPKRAFQPFGPQPVVGSHFSISCPEALAKPLSGLTIALTWQNAPSDLNAWYSGYSRRANIANGVQATLTYEDGAGVQSSQVLNLMNRVDGITTLSPTTPLSIWQSQSAAAGRPGLVIVALDEDFLHADYRKETLADHQIPRNQPYTPVVQQISLNYSARLPLTDLRGNGAEAFAAAANLQFFHIGGFGARREHAFLRRDLAWVADKQPGLLPLYPDEGECMIGVGGIAAGESIHLLLQVAEGSANPDLPAQPVHWSVLCGNHWRRVAPDELALDTSRGLRASGVVGIVLSRFTSTDNSWLPAGPVWLKAGIATGSSAACRLVGVHVNAIEAVRQWPDGSKPPIETLPPATVNKLLAPPAGLKKVTQPYATFGGRAGESQAMLRRRAAERLRHRQRCITPWDYERLLLEEFPGVYRVKCIPHASDTSWTAPGHVLIVAVPDLSNHNRPDPLQPRVDLDTLTRMRDLAQAHAADGVSVHVRNPEYLAVRLDFKVRFRPGLPFDHSRQQLHGALVEALSPWAFASDRQLVFGGRLYRSVLLDFVKELAYVDDVTDFRFGPAGTGELLLADVAEIAADRPDVILVSADRHLIGEAIA